MAELASLLRVLLKKSSEFKNQLKNTTKGQKRFLHFKNKYISQEDLYTTDALVMSKVNKFLHKDDSLKVFWERMNGGGKIVNNPTNYDAIIACKSRLVDPLFEYGDVLKKLSQEYVAWSDILSKELGSKKYFLKLLE